MADRIEHDLAALDQAELRLAERARQRGEARERRSGRRALRRRWLEVPARLAVPGLAGAAVLALLLWISGGDLSGWPYPLALATAAAAFIAPALVAARRAREYGAFVAMAAGLATFGLQLALTFGFAFPILNLGP